MYPFAVCSVPGSLSRACDSSPLGRLWSSDRTRKGHTRRRNGMHTWAKRGLQTALVTGGLFMLGTGIASAQDNVHPDVKPTGIDGLVNASPQAGTAPAPLADVPMQLKRNDVNTPVG